MRNYNRVNTVKQLGLTNMLLEKNPITNGSVNLPKTQGGKKYSEESKANSYCKKAPQIYHDLPFNSPDALIFNIISNHTMNPINKVINPAI